MVALSFGGFLGSFPGITAENWGVTYVGTNYGWMFTAYGVAAIAGPQLGARLAQANQGDYTMASLSLSAWLSLVFYSNCSIWLKLKKFKNESLENPRIF